MLKDAPVGAVFDQEGEHGRDGLCSAIAFMTWNPWIKIAGGLQMSRARKEVFVPRETD